MLAEELRQAILQAAIEGKLTEQLSKDTECPLQGEDLENAFDLPIKWK